MGYYTYYTLNCEQDGREADINEQVVLEKLFEINPDLKHYYNRVPDNFHDFFWDEMTWYEHDEDMIKLSLAFPDILFILSGDGEEHVDSWKGYYKNGKSFLSEAEIIYPEPPVGYFD